MSNRNFTFKKVTKGKSTILEKWLCYIKPKSSSFVVDGFGDTTKESVEIWGVPNTAIEKDQLIDEKYIITSSVPIKGRKYWLWTGEVA